MKEMLIRRYLIENGYNRDSEIKDLDFEIWLQRFNRYNIIFGKLIKLEELVTDENMVELCSDLDYNVLKNSILPNDRKYVLSDFGIGYRPKSISQTSKDYLIANGAYFDLKSNLLKTGDRSFSVGICGDIRNEYTQKMINYYKSLKNGLEQLGFDNIQQFEERNNDEVIVLLNHIKDGQKVKKREYKPIYRTVSQR